MSRFSLFTLLAMVMLLGAKASYLSGPSDRTSPITFNKDVLPVLQKNCQDCHRPGEAAPMSFLTYESTRPWAKAIKTAVVAEKCRPGLRIRISASSATRRTLTEADIRTFAAWADSGALEGSADDKPAPREWTDGWRIKPDVIVSMPEASIRRGKGCGRDQRIPDSESLYRRYLGISIEIRPGDPSVVHHVILQIPERPGPRLQRLRSALGRRGCSCIKYAGRRPLAAGTGERIPTCSRSSSELKTGEGVLHDHGSRLCARHATTGLPVSRIPPS